MHENRTDPDPRFVLTLYGEFDQHGFQSWINDHWTVSLWHSVLYVLTIFSVQRYMRDRPRFELRYPLIVWSSVLAVFSILGASRTVPEFVQYLYRHGFERSMCDPKFYFTGDTAFWGYLFTISKVYEFGDTAFIVLRKQPLIFLHWYHHVTVLVYCFYSYTDNTASARWFMTVNYAVHALMYSYYALRAMKIRLPRWISMVITTLQILQMVVGLVVSATVYRVKVRGDPCHSTYMNILYCAAMYLSYFLLFSHFFYNTYLKQKGMRTAGGGQDRTAHQGGKHKGGHVMNGVQPIANGVDPTHNGVKTVSNGVQPVANGTTVHEEKKIK